ncbi:uncharacterized protein TNIN_417531 [Trichonephila inaurata madagascariensis]|uniref:Uncharacterized protein n=1 Tax=Trichonephila inaurata madagascariensis TaxID=2747483 RepID=A0A8X6Y124_9ARAC|nr:uncharacterized protein TNIN_417531 [Trichonephila inaurata madagascariensis]
MDIEPINVTEEPSSEGLHYLQEKGLLVGQVARILLQSLGLLLDNRTKKGLNFDLQLKRLTSSSLVPIIIHTLVAVWPLTFAIVGLSCFLECPANPLLPLLIFMTGFFCTVTIILRLVKSMWLHLLDADLTFRLQLGIIGLDFTFVMLFSVYNCTLYTLNPSFDSYSKNYCNYSFYNFNYKLNFVSIALLVLYTFWKILPIMKLCFSSLRS